MASAVDMRACSVGAKLLRSPHWTGLADFKPCLDHFRRASTQRILNYPFRGVSKEVLHSSGEHQKLIASTGLLNIAAENASPQSIPGVSKATNKKSQFAWLSVKGITSLGSNIRRVIVAMMFVAFGWPATNPSLTALSRISRIKSPPLT